MAEIICGGLNRTMQYGNGGGLIEEKNNQKV